MSAYLAARFTRPLRRLGEATRRLGSGDLAGRVSAAELESSYAEVADLARQFNAMAERLEESIDLIRRDRDRSRDFLADVSHELRTPLAALRMNTELLQGQAGSDPATRAEFLATSRGQLDRLDWLAHNLLELSKLESGLLRLDLRPDDLRSTVESAVEQAEPAGRRRGVAMELRLPSNPVRIRHDPQRIGQVVANLLGNAIKFTPPGGSVVLTLEAHRDGARLEVRDTGRRHRRERDPPHLRALLPRLAGERGARIRQRPGAGDREVDRRHARRPNRGGEPGWRGDHVHRDPAARPEAGRGPRGAASGAPSCRAPAAS